jgi:hypothetical protein
VVTSAGILVDSGRVRADNEVMSSVPHTQISLPTELVKQLEADAKANGVELSTYVLMLKQLAARRPDGRAREAAQFMVAKHAESLRKLAQ